MSRQDQSVRGITLSTSYQVRDLYTVVRGCFPCVINVRVGALADCVHLSINDSVCLGVKFCECLQLRPCVE